MGRTIMSAGARCGAMMATLRCDHPDIEAFIDAKADAARLRNFNLSVLVTDAFMDAVAKDASWPLVFEGKVYREVAARGLWERLMRATYDYAEPGVIFIDRVNRQNNLGYLEEIHATNPCGEQPLPPYGACLLGSINLTAFVTRAFTPDAALDLAALEVQCKELSLRDLHHLARRAELRQHLRVARAEAHGLAALDDLLAQSQRDRRHAVFRTHLEDRIVVV